MNEKQSDNKWIDRFLSYVRHKEERRCVLCGNQDERTLAGKALCETCLDKNREASRETREKRRAEHCCVRCGKKDKWTKSGRYNCMDCSMKQMQYRFKKHLERKKQNTEQAQERMTE